MTFEERLAKGEINEQICKIFCEMYGFSLVKKPRIEDFTEDFDAIWPDKKQSLFEVKSNFEIARDPYYFYLLHDTWIWIASISNIFYCCITEIKFKISDEKFKYKGNSYDIPYEEDHLGIRWFAPRLFEPNLYKCYKETKSGNDFAYISSKESSFKKLIPEDKVDEYYMFHKHMMDNFKKLIGKNLKKEEILLIMDKELSYLKNKKFKKIDMAVL